MTISATTAIALAMLALILGGGLAWAYFRIDLRDQVIEIEDLEADLAHVTSDLDDMTEARDLWRTRALDSERSLELVLAEGKSQPLTAPVQLIRGAR